MDAGDSLFLRLRWGAFDPLRELPTLPQELSYSSKEAAVAGTRILQFSGPVKPEWKQAVVAAGGQLGSYLPDYAFLAHLEGEALERVRALPFVRWVGPYQPAYKLAPGVDYDEVRSYRVLLAPWADPAASRSALAALSGEPRSYAGGLVAVLGGSQIDQVAHMEDVVWIEPFYLQRTFNDIGGGTIMGGSTAWSNGYTGDGVTIAVADTGLDTGSAGTIHQDFSGRVTNISSWPVQNINWGGGCIPDNVGADDGAADESSGHGTHVAGSVAGDGSRSSGQIKGLGYDASVTFQAVEQDTDWPSGCSLSDGYYLTGIPDDVRTLLNEAYGWGARVHNNSWGGGVAGDYDQQAAYFDEFIHGHEDMAVVVAAGNEGEDGDADGYVDEDSISSPGTAKNVITVGASDNERSSGGAQGTWYQYWGSTYPTTPTRDDQVSDDRDELAAFSSRGPMDDNRIKPDVVAPGTNILSVRSSQASGTGWGVYDQYYMYMGGTSMASPLVAGAATVVREYYAEGEGHANPSAALVKATLINSAVDMTGYGNSSEEAGQPIPNNHEGWGRVNVAAATTPNGRQFVDETIGVDTGETDTYYYNLQSGQPFKVSLVWSDYPALATASSTLVNDLNLRVTAPDGTTTYWGNRFSGGWSQSGGGADAVNNVENVYVQSAAGGSWTVEVIGQNVPQGPQAYALVVDGDIMSEVLSVTGFQPSTAPNDAVLNDAVVSGAGFDETAEAHLVRGATVVTGTAATVYTTTDTIEADFDLNGVAVGWWDVRVSNSLTDTATLTDALYVKDASLPDLAVAQTASASEVDAGGRLTYTIAISNAGSVTATGVIFTDTLPGDVDFESLTPSCQGGTVTLPDGFSCRLDPDSLSAGANVLYTLVVSVSDAAQGTLVNRVVVASDVADGYGDDNQAQVSVEVSVRDIYLPFVMRNWPPQPSGPKAGFWESQTGDEFYVTPDQSNVDDFAIYIFVQQCNPQYYKITHTALEPIANDAFSFSGSFYASGTFDSETAAQGTDGLDDFYISGCGYVSGGPWSWSATWQDSSQPTFLRARLVAPDSLEPLTDPVPFYKVVPLEVE